LQFAFNLFEEQPDRESYCFTGVRIAPISGDFARTKGDFMKKLLLTLLLLSSFSFIGSSNAVSAATPVVGNPQLRIQIGQRRRRWRNRNWAEGERVGYGRTFTRDVQRGWRLYRETYQVRYLPNGMTQTMLISRVRIR
jgi:hypothetical protein